MFGGIFLYTAVVITIYSGALESPDTLLSYYMIVVALYDTIILIITYPLISTPKSTLNQHRYGTPILLSQEEHTFSAKVGPTELQVSRSLTLNGLFLYTVGILFHVECCIR